MIYGNFIKAIDYVEHRLLDTSYPIKTEKWQGMENPPEMRETLNVSIQVVMPDNINKLVEDVKPNVKWANEHFEERVGCIPINPGKSYLNWPYAAKSKESLNKEIKFNHNYMERIWPKYAGQPGMMNPDKYYDKPHKGIRYEYGDLLDLVNHLKQAPYTRQAYLPIWFPEDTGVIHGGRVPCTLGYHFIRRGNFLHIVYFIRSCDYIRHFRDDVYLAVRKVMWVIGQLINLDKENWIDVKPGTFTMHITSLHCFVSDYEILKKNENKNNQR